MAARIEENEHIRGEHVFFFLVYSTTTYIHTHKCDLSSFPLLLLLAAGHIHSFIQSKGVSQALNRLFLFFST